MPMGTTTLGEFTLDVATDDRGRIVAEVWHTASGKTLGITEVDRVADAEPWARKTIELAGGVANQPLGFGPTSEDETMSGPFADAKVGDWIITSTSKDCQQITEVSPLGSVKCGKYTTYYKDGTHSRSRNVTARLATPEELSAWQVRREEERQRAILERDQELRLERIRHAAPDLLTALRQALAWIGIDKRAGLISADVAQVRAEVLEQAIVKATGD